MVMGEKDGRVVAGSEGEEEEDKGGGGGRVSL